MRNLCVKLLSVRLLPKQYLTYNPDDLKFNLPLLKKIAGVFPAQDCSELIVCPDYFAVRAVSYLPDLLRDAPGQI